MAEQADLTVPPGATFEAPWWAASRMAAAKGRPRALRRVHSADVSPLVGNGASPGVRGATPLAAPAHPHVRSHRGLCRLRTGNGSRSVLPATKAEHRASGLGSRLPRDANARGNSTARMSNRSPRIVAPSPSDRDVPVKISANHPAHRLARGSAPTRLTGRSSHPEPRTDHNRAFSGRSPPRPSRHRGGLLARDARPKNPNTEVKPFPHRGADT